MEHIEIDHIEVSDININVTYWVSGHEDAQQLSFKTGDFEKWLVNSRDTSINAYWDHWDSFLPDEMGSVILYQDIKQYLWYRFEMLKPAGERTNVQPYPVKKPMSRVSKNGLTRSQPNRKSI